MPMMVEDFIEESLIDDKKPQSTKHRKESEKLSKFEDTSFAAFI